MIFFLEEKIYFIQVSKGNFTEEFRQLNLSEEIVEGMQKLAFQDEVETVEHSARGKIKGERKKDKKVEINWIERLTAAMLENHFFIEKAKVLENGGIKEFRGEQRIFENLKEQYQAVFADLQCFPVGEDVTGQEQCFYDNSWYGERTYGGERVHEGTDIMTSNNQRGYFPVYSMTDGVIEKMGWLKLGGWRIGIRAPSGGYFYYAHLHSYAEGLKDGDVVKAGQLIGYVGDSGYSKIEGTVGQFDVHLHVGIYIQDEVGQEISVNPYWVLRFLENRKIRF